VPEDAAPEDHTAGGDAQSAGDSVPRSSTCQWNWAWNSWPFSSGPCGIRPTSPNLSDKVECSHPTDRLQLCQLLDYTDNVDLREKLAVWEGVLQRASPARWTHETHSLRGCEEEAVNRGRAGQPDLTPAAPFRPQRLVL
jgi:hypothetical protein